MSQTQPILALTPDPLIGQRLGDFVVEAPMAAGGMGVVYRARHPVIGRLAAIKVLKPEVAADSEQTDRFVKEARALAAIKHRGIVEIIGFGDTPDGRQYMATEFLDGESLEAIIAREGQMPPMRVLDLVDEILNALSAAHKSGVMHRDLKPSNVFLSRQSTGERIVKLLDFGLAKQSPVTLADVAEGPLAKASLVAGTPEYIAPEQARGFAATPRTDLYCLGVMMFEMLSGTLPFKADSIVEMLKKHVYEQPPELSGRVSNLPETLYDLVMQLLEKEPEKRPGSAELVRQVVTRLARQLQQESTVQRPNPLKPSQPLPVIVPAPFRTAEPDAPTPPLDPRKIQTEPVLRTPTADKLERELARPNRGPWYAIGVVAVAALLVWLLWPRGPEPLAVTPAPPPAPKPVVELKPPELVEAPVPAPKPAEPDDPLPQIPKPAKVEKPVKQPTPVAVVAPTPAPLLAAPSCVVSPEWKVRQRARLETVYRDVAAALLDKPNGPDQLPRVQAVLSEWTRKLDALQAGDDCGEVRKGVEDWAVKELK